MWDLRGQQQICCPACVRKSFFVQVRSIKPVIFNNIAFGKNYLQPRLRLPGTGGIPDVTTFIDDIHLYVPRHSRLVFSKKLDFISGLGHHPDRRWGSGPRYLVSDLGQFDFGGVDENDRPHMRLTSFHPWASIEHIQSHTGFELAIAENIQPTPLPSKSELQLLREEIDPLGISRLESLSGASRRELLHQIIATEGGL